MINFEKKKPMSIKEFAYFFYHDIICKFCTNPKSCVCVDNKTYCMKGIKDWLNSEVKNEVK